jgi:nicotinamidase-related amidase
MTVRTLQFGPIREAAHVAIDMQTLFAEGTEWAAPATRAALPAVMRLAAHAPARTVFTRFRTPAVAEQAPGQWRHYYGRWQSVLAGRHPEPTFDLLPELRAHAPPAAVVDKPTYSAWEAPAFAPALQALGARTLILSGVETDVCVLATALGAIDRGFRVILAADALGSSSEAGHRATLEAVIPRYDQQVELLAVSDILAHWTP